MLTEPLGTNFSEISIEIHTLSFKKMRFKMSSVKQQTSCLSLNVSFIVQYVFAQQNAYDWHIISETDTR